MAPQISDHNLMAQNHQRWSIFLWICSNPWCKVEKKMWTLFFREQLKHMTNLQLKQFESGAKHQGTWQMMYGQGTYRSEYPKTRSLKIVSPRESPASPTGWVGFSEWMSGPGRNFFKGFWPILGGFWMDGLNPPGRGGGVVGGWVWTTGKVHSPPGVIEWIYGFQLQTEWSGFGCCIFIFVCGV